MQTNEVLWMCLESFIDENKKIKRNELATKEMIRPQKLNTGVLYSTPVPILLKEYVFQVQNDF